jgi:hypothetical protein
MRERTGGATYRTRAHVRALGVTLALLLLGLPTARARQQPAPAPDPWKIRGNDEIRKVLSERIGRGGVGTGVGIVVGVIEPVGRRVVTQGRAW